MKTDLLWYAIVGLFSFYGARQQSSAHLIYFNYIRWRQRTQPNDSLSTMTSGIGHSLEVLVIDAKLCEGRLQAQRVEGEVAHCIDCFLCALKRIQPLLYAKHLHAQAVDGGCCLLIADIGKPARGEDSKAMAVRNVVIRRQLVLHIMAGTVVNGACIEHTVKCH